MKNVMLVVALGLCSNATWGMGKEKPLALAAANFRSRSESPKTLIIDRKKNVLPRAASVDGNALQAKKENALKEKEFEKEVLKMRTSEAAKMLIKRAERVEVRKDLEKMGVDFGAPEDEQIPFTTQEQARIDELLKALSTQDERVGALQRKLAAEQEAWAREQAKEEESRAAQKTVTQNDQDKAANSNPEAATNSRQIPVKKKGSGVSSRQYTIALIKEVALKQDSDDEADLIFSMDE